MSAKGFTLVEILLAVSIFLILILAAYTVMDVGRNAWFINNASGELRQEIIRAFMRMETELKETSPGQVSLSVGNFNSTFTFKVPQDRDMDGTILDSEGDIEWPDDNITYSLDMGLNKINRIVKNITTNTIIKADILANDIVDLRFTRPVLLPPRCLQIDVTARKRSPIKRVLQEAGRIIIKMRN